MLKAANSSVRFLAEPIPTTYSPWRQHFYTDPLPAKKRADGILEGSLTLSLGGAWQRKLLFTYFKLINDSIF